MGSPLRTAAGSAWAPVAAPLAKRHNTEVRTNLPLSERSAADIRAQAEEYGRMAATARTADARRSLTTLATRFAALADAREANEAGAAHRPGASATHD